MGQPQYVDLQEIKSKQMATNSNHVLYFVYMPLSFTIHFSPAPADSRCNLLIRAFPS
jgi:hypothetical protein